MRAVTGMGSSPRRWRALFIAIALLGTSFAVIVPFAPSGKSATTAAGGPVDRTTTPPGDALEAAPDLLELGAIGSEERHQETVAPDHDERLRKSARAFVQHRHQAFLRRLACNTSADFAELADVPADVAMPRLHELALSGDGAAATYFAARIDLCEVDRAGATLIDTLTRQRRRAAVDLSAGGRAFIDAITDAESDRLRQLCKGYDAGQFNHAALIDLVRRRAGDRGVAPEVLKALEAGGIDLPKDVFDVPYQEKRECEPALSAGTFSADRSEGFATAAGWRALAAMSGISAELATAFDACADRSCASLGDLPEAVRGDALLALARAGNHASANRMSYEADAAGDRTSALEWLLYRRWLSLTGCRDMLDNVNSVSLLTHSIEKLVTRMSASERAAAIRRAQARIATDGALAERIGCLP